MNEIPSSSAHKSVKEENHLIPASTHRFAPQQLNLLNAIKLFCCPRLSLPFPHHSQNLYNWPAASSLQITIIYYRTMFSRYDYVNIPKKY
ncbi:hypothetical protein ALC53_04959 [Atta colombica]|uniref:Uncharacterized protein n=1 Tax=Atta colombica TaxID=520822 RepID=A0A195BKN5_9HYME|nr:hypothetical protein ALC53_04959 [Atta colombica]